MNIIHDAENNKFYCVVDGKECLVEYLIDGNSIDFYHTFVDPSLRGRGMAKQLYDYISEWLKEEKKNGQEWTVKTSCSYAEKYFEGK